MTLSSANNHSHLLLTLTFLIVSLSLFEPVLGWILVLVVCSVVMRLALYLKLHKHAPSIRTLNLLALLSAIVLAYFSLQLGVLLGMVNLLVMACALKLMLLRTDKDYYQLVTSCGFIVGCGFIFQQGIGFSLFYFISIILLLLSLALHVSPSKGLNKVFKHVLLMGVQATPIALVLFLVLPQIGPLWQMPSSKRSQTGLTEKVTPGDIADLSQSSDLAFRATFENGQVPPFNQRYWRTLVLEQFDGSSWEVAPQRKQIRRQYLNFNKEFSPLLDGAFYDYEIIAQPTHQRWLFALDIAQPKGYNSDQKIWQSQEYQLISKTPLVSRYHYNVRSYPNMPLNQSLYSVDSRLNLQLPDSGNPKTQQWARQLRQQYPSDQQYIQAVMSYFSEQNFSYTLQPPLMPDDPVDTFLFEQQSGFCSHYASALAYVLRLGSIPARLVTGYQGGELHQQGYLSVYQYDAHAWVEVWYDNKGWQRLDPTAMVAPERINLGLRGAISEQEYLFDAPFSLAKLSNIPWLNELRLILADVDYNWSKWVLGFDKDKQQDLFKSILGKLTPQKMAIFGAMTLALICALLALFYLPPWRRQKTDKASLYYNKAVRMLQQKGVTREQHQGPLDFAGSLSDIINKDAASAFTRLTQHFITQKYRPHDAASKHKSLHLMVIELNKLKKSLKQQSQAQPEAVKN